MPIDMREVRIYTFTGGVNSPVKMMLVHIPTGATVEGVGKSQYRLRQELLATLEREIEKHNAAVERRAD